MTASESGTDRLAEIVSLIDLTNLNDDCDRAAVKSLCSQAHTAVGNVAALCIWPDFIVDAKELLDSESSLKIATVVNFPSGSEPVSTTCAAIDKALNDGAHEIDYVLPYGELINGNITQVSEALQTVRKCIPSHALLKVILETGMLGSNEQIGMASKLAIEQGADFIKTSTGKVQINATPEAAKVMIEAIASSQSDTGFKAAGGIKTVEDAIAYLSIAEDIMGKDWISETHFRFGASGLLQDVLSRLNGDSTTASHNRSDY